jgi:hypothetical protein
MSVLATSRRSRSSISDILCIHYVMLSPLKDAKCLECLFWQIALRCDSWGWPEASSEYTQGQIDAVHLTLGQVRIQKSTPSNFL